MSERDMPSYAGPDMAGRKRMMTNEEIKRRFDNETASCYSQRQPAWFLEFEYAFGLVPELVKPFAQAGSVILDLGAGTGNLTRAVLEKIDGVQAVLLDFSVHMLSEAGKVLKDFPGRWRTETGDFAEADLGRERYAAVVSSFAIHHLRTEAAYLALYRKIRSGLKAPGAFVCCDVVAGGHDLLTQRNEAEWTAFLAAQGYAASDIDRLISNHHVEDSPLAVGAHLALLKAAGFGAVDVVWKKANFAVYIGLTDG